MSNDTASGDVATRSISGSSVALRRSADESLQQRFQSLFDHADVVFNGKRDWDIRVHNLHLFSRLLRNGSLGFAEAYMDGWWDCPRLDRMFTRILAADLSKKVMGIARLKWVASACWHALVNLQKESRAFEVGEVHYDIGNDLYQHMLDPTMSYSCGYWAYADDLDTAQQHKLDLICRKLELQPGMTLLDIGCGWGGLAEYAARHYGVKVTGITISREQKKLAERRTKLMSGLPVDIQLIDYRSLKGQFDRIVSVGMFEHVGPKNYRKYFRTVKRLLKAEGLFLLHSIGDERTTHVTDPFISKYIFPNGKIASRKHLHDTSLDLFRLEDWHNFGPDYDRTLMAWAKNFERAWPELEANYSERFYRMWRYYLYSCAGFFRCRNGQLWQVVFAHPDRQAEYRSLR